jgi:hypothetical protein
VKAGRYDLFRCRIRILESEADLEEIVKGWRRSRYLEIGRLRVGFERPSLRIYWAGTELTTRHGGFTSICSGTMWHDSLQAYWRFEKKDDNTGVACGRWRRLPLEQVWTVSLVDEHTVTWSIDLHAAEQVEMEECDTSLMVANGYNRWSTGYGEGAFPPIRHENDWEHASGQYRAGRYVSAHADRETFPSIKMEFRGPRDDFIGTAVNTGRNMSARVLQCLDILDRGRRIIAPGEYRLLDLTIHIGEP